MADLLRHELALSSEIWVIKVGTRVLTHANGRLNEDRVAALAAEIDEVQRAGRKVVLVSSGAVGSGMGQLGLTQRPTDVSRLQACAAVGQSYLVQTYDRAFRQFGRHAAQILLTAEDLSHRRRYLNVRNTLLALFEFGAVPIINENDSVSVEELKITFGDNDRLAALVTSLFRDCLLVILSDVAGLYDRDPQDPTAQVVSTVTKLDQSVYDLVRDRKTGLSKGGMASKLNAARIVTTAGENVIIASGRERGALAKILAGDSIGTLFLSKSNQVTSWKRWFAFSAQPQGLLTLDDGARRAVEHDGRSLLPIGVKAVQGTFDKGDVVSLQDLQGREFARGLTNYTADETQRILGLKMDQVAATLGHSSYSELIHRDNLFVLGSL